MNNVKLNELLNELHACSEARAWAKGKTLAEVWLGCGRGDWLLWLAGRMQGEPGWFTREQVVLAACDCAETSLKFVREGEDRPQKCLEVVRAWATGNATLEEVRVARVAAYAAYAYAASDAAYAASDAAYAASYAASAAAYAAAAAYASAYASAAFSASAYAAAAASDASDAAAYAAAASDADRKKTLKECAELVRARLVFSAEETASYE
jgi:hypothetical protein